jgi:uncharacterized protein YrrD
MITRWHLLNLPVHFSDRRHRTMRVVDVLMDWPTPTVAGFLVRRRLRIMVLPVSTAVKITPFGLEVGMWSQAEAWSRSRVRAHLAKTASWMHALVVDRRDRPIGIVRDLILDERHPTVRGFVVSRGLLHDLWAGTLVVSCSQIEVSTVRCIKWQGSGETIEAHGIPEGGGPWTV